MKKKTFFNYILPQRLEDDKLKVSFDESISNILVLARSSIDSLFFEVKTFNNW